MPEDRLVRVGIKDRIGTIQGARGAGVGGKGLGHEFPAARCERRGAPDIDGVVHLETAVIRRLVATQVGGLSARKETQRKMQGTNEEDDTWVPFCCISD